MPRALASIICEYAEHEGSAFTAPDAIWEPTVFTRDAAGHVRAHEFHEPDDAAAVTRIQGIVADAQAVATGLLLRVLEPEHVLVTTTDGSEHVAAAATIERAADGPPVLGAWRPVPAGEPVATFSVNLLRRALGLDTLAQREGALEEIAIIRRALDGLLNRVDADGHLAASRDDEVVLEADRLGLVELARDALELAASRGRADRQIDDGVVLKRVPTPPGG